jgi:quinol-cytochrome oxidoreductase complex cytochrome b subunit
LKPAVAGDLAAAEIVPEKSAKPRLFDNRWVVLGMIFFVLGPFGLPMLWQSQAFSRREKWIWAIVTALYVIALCWLTYYLLVKMVLEPLSRLRF